MRKAAAVLAAMMVLLAGCGGGGGGDTASPTEAEQPETTEEPMPSDETTSSDDDTDSTPTPDDDDTDTTPTPDPTPTPTPDDDQDEAQVNVTAALSSINTTDPFNNASELEVTLYNGSEQIDLLFQNDTDAGRELIQVNAANRGTTTLYTTSDYVALRNTTSGAVQYAEPGSGLGTSVSFSAAFLALGGLAFVGVVEWDEGDTTTIDGETAYVFEANSLNETVLDSDQGLDYNFDPDNVESVDGRMVISSEGRIQSISVQLETPEGTFGSDISFGYGDISIAKPDWVDESEAP